jgi:hypothetical protein
MGFAFEISGSTVPPFLRFQVMREGDDTFCSLPSKQVVLGPNTFLFSELIHDCFRVDESPGPTAETVKTNLIKIAWQVSTSLETTIPFDLCVSNLRAIRK